MPHPAFDEDGPDKETETREDEATPVADRDAPNRAEPKNADEALVSPGKPEDEDF